MRTCSAEVSDSVLSGSRQIVDALRRATADGLNTGDLTQLLEVACSHRNQLDAAITGLIGALDQATEKADHTITMGLSCASWLSHNLHISSSAAHAQVHLARQLPFLPVTASACQRGELSSQHASVIGRIVESVTRGGGEPGEAECLMLQEAGQRDPRDLLRWGLSLVHQLAPPEMVAEEEQRHRRDVEGHLDPEGGATLKTALHGLLGPRLRGDDRTPGQRRADGLVEIARRVLDRGELPVRGGQRPHLTVTATLETLRGDAGAPAALLDWGWPISGKALRRIALDAEITPILVSAKGDPLHVGRKYRNRDPEDAQGAGGEGSPVRLAGVRSSAGVVAGTPRGAMGAGWCDRGRRDEPTLRQAPRQAEPGLAAGAPARPPGDRAPTDAGAGQRLRRPRSASPP